MKVLVTGANGFIGEHLCAHLIARGDSVRGALRQNRPDWRLCEQVVIGDIGAETDWSAALEGIECVVHLAGRAHVMQECEADPLALFRQVNVAGSQKLARQAVNAGVKRMIFISSIKVNGERSGHRPFHSDDIVAPEDPYGQSKWEAEQVLSEVAQETGMELVILRPVLIYGRGVKGNMQRLAALISRGIPLPLGRVNNRRSLLSIENLVDFISCCMVHPAAAGELFLVADGEDLSTPQLINRLAYAMHRPVRLLPLPIGLLRIIGRFTGRASEIERLCGDLQVDIEKNRQLLGWTPKVSVAAALNDMFNQEETT
ncbi:MAG: SDR family oxidoreductase [Candidatus Thiodiazotropha sp.]|jgi:nucleoside-diphosphate-sugar epimerase